MPELPEVESVARQLRMSKPPVIGSKVTAVELAWDGVVMDMPPGDFVSAVTGRTLKDVLRHGKYLFFNMEDSSSEIVMAMHLRMTGIAWLAGPGEPTSRHNRFSMYFDCGLSMRFDDPRKFGRIWLVNDIREVISTMGPDALDIDEHWFAGRLRTLDRQLKPLLLDQSFVAGIGNIYADESLHLAGLHPLRKSSSLDAGEVSRLYGAITAVLREAVDTGGANIDGVFKAGGYRVRVYRRDGHSCSRCGGQISKIRVGQRGTHYCPVCQPVQR